MHIQHNTCVLVDAKENIRVKGTMPKLRYCDLQINECQQPVLLYIKLPEVWEQLSSQYLIIYCKSRGFVLSFVAQLVHY